MNTKERKFHFDNYYIDKPIQYGEIYLYQIGDLYCQKGYEVPEHIQICHEISCVVSGLGTFYADGKAYPIKAGDLFISPVGTRHMIRSSRSMPLRFYYCGLTVREDFENGDYTRLEKFFSKAKEYPLSTDRDSSIRQVFTMLFHEFIINDLSSKLLIKTELNQLLLLTRRCYEKGATVQRKMQQNQNFREHIVYDIINYVDNNIFGIHRLTDISTQIGYSYSYVTQTFTSIMGISLESYYQEKRFEKAAELLKAFGNVTQVSEAMGFDSVQSFSRFFKKYGGVPPSKYAQLGKN